MNAQQRFVVLCAAMIDECWLERVQNEIDVLPDVIDWFEDERHEETLEYVSYQDDVTWMRGGC